MSNIQLERENERLKIYNDDLRAQMNNKDIKYQEEIQKLKNEHLNKIKELEDKIKKLESKINLQTRKRQISDDEVKRIKELRASGVSYSQIKKETGWSSVTINRVINGIYD